ncbi:MAG: hypothetical protein IJZ42_07040 [Lachnospiraceae bacterium]|nr:hypothetical protein [Lachnospiraceae bacterium]
MKTYKELYEYVNTSYGCSHMWIADISNDLKISYNATRHLISASGFYRHKRVRTVSLQQFSSDPWVIYIKDKLERRTL